MRMRCSRRLWAYLGFALLVIATVSLQLVHFDDLNFRQDELVTAYAGASLSLDAVVAWMTRDIHPPLWHVLGAAWAGWFGLDEGLNRWQSALWTALALAFTFRLASDLYGRAVGLVSVVVLGTLALFQFYSHEFRPYAMLAALTVGLQWIALRWLYRPTLTWALLLVGCGGLLLYTHYFGLYVIAGLALTGLILTRWQWVRYLRAVGLLLAIGLLFAGWLLPFLQMLLLRADGIAYDLEPDLTTLPALLTAISLRAPEISLFLLGTALLLPTRPAAGRLSGRRGRMIFRFARWWRRLYPLLFAAATLGLTLLLNPAPAALTPRNFIILTPSLALLFALGVTGLPRRLQPLVLLLIVVPAIFAFRNLEHQLPYRQVIALIAPDYQPGEPIIVHSGLDSTTHSTISFNLLAHLPGLRPDDLIQLNEPRRGDVPTALPNTITGISGDDVQRFNTLLGGAEQVWYVQGVIDTGRRDFYRDVLEQAYAPLGQAAWRDYGSGSTMVTQFQRIPPDLERTLVFGDNFTLMSWTLRDSVQVQPCQTITYESWWTSQQLTDTNYSMTLVLADSGGIGVARTDRHPGYLETSEWIPGDLYPDIRQLTIPCDIQPGEYLLLIGIYDPNAPDNALPVTTIGGERLGSNVVYMTSLFVG